MVMQLSFRLALVLGNQFSLGVQRRVHGEMRQIQKPGPVLILSDELIRLVIQVVGQIEFSGNP